MKAKYSGICPFCHIYIRKNVSEITALPSALIPRTLGDRGVFSSDTNLPYHADGHPIELFARKFAHKRCAEQFQGSG